MDFQGFETLEDLFLLAHKLCLCCVRSCLYSLSRQGVWVVYWGSSLGYNGKLGIVMNRYQGSEGRNGSWQRRRRKGISIGSRR
jgi:hypothetical protein